MLLWDQMALESLLYLILYQEKMGYEVEKGDIELDDESILDDEPDERAEKVFSWLFNIQ